MGILLAFIIIFFWAAHLLYSLFYVQTSVANPWMWFHMLVQGYLYTGLFITAHDAMHGSISVNRKINNALGRTAAFLFAGMWFPRLRRKHMLHHQFPGTGKDPDFNERHQNFWLWWFGFMKNYVTWYQLIIMAVIFNLLMLAFPQPAIFAFWVIPAFLGTLQLFYFGTYVPHRKPHTPDMDIHRTRTQKRNHVKAMLTCYFFGYHHEHHLFPLIPWWRLYQTKEKRP